MNFNKKKKLIFGSLIVFLIVTIFLLLIIEIGCRIHLNAYFSKYNTDLTIQGKSRWISNDTLIWTNRPFFLEYNLSNQYNEYGMRVMPSYTEMPTKGENDFWVFLFGGSAMAGMGSNKAGEWFNISGVNDHSISNSIDDYLEKQLQEFYPNKNVKVFNAAVSMTGVWQSKLRYEQLAFLNPDWVISMDGVNEPTNLKPNESTRQFFDSLWKSNPTQNFPLKGTFKLMSNSGLYYKLGKYLYHKREEIAIKNIQDSLQTYQNKWVSQGSKKIVFNPSPFNLAARDTFIANMHAFKKLLLEKNQKHLLLLQPFIALRDTSKLTLSEKATYNYYTHKFNDVNQNSFFKLLYDSLKYSANGVFVMENMHTNENPVFVDYCHFTKEANREIAQEIGKYIFSNGNYIPFKKDTIPN